MLYQLSYLGLFNSNERLTTYNKIKGETSQGSREKLPRFASILKNGRHNGRAHSIRSGSLGSRSVYKLYGRCTLSTGALRFRLSARRALRSAMITTACMVRIVLLRFGAADVALPSAGRAAACLAIHTNADTGQ